MENGNKLYVENGNKMEIRRRCCDGLVQTLFYLLYWM